jgi:hypothetical protein
VDAFSVALVKMDIHLEKVLCIALMIESLDFRFGIGKMYLLLVANDWQWDPPKMAGSVFMLNHGRIF